MSVFDPTQSNINKIFNSQPFQLVELDPESMEEKDFSGESPDRADQDSFSVSPMVQTRRTSPWDLGDLDSDISLLIDDVQLPFETADNVAASPPELPVEAPFNPFPAPSEEEVEATTAAPKKLKVFQADVISNENYSYRASTTTYPVDRLGDIADHSAFKSFSISVSAVHSETVLSYSDTIGNIINSPLVIGAQNLASYWGLIDPEQKIETRVQAAFRMLTEWNRTGTPLLVKCQYAREGFRDEEGKIIPFVIESLSIPRNKNVGQAIRISMNLRRIKLVELGVTSNTGYEGGGRTKGSGKKRDAPLSKKKGKPVNNDRLDPCLYSGKPGGGYIVNKTGKACRFDANDKALAIAQYGANSGDL